MRRLAATAVMHAGSSSATADRIDTSGFDLDNGKAAPATWLCTVRLMGLIVLLFTTGGMVQAQMPSSCVVGTNVYYIDNVGGSDSNSQPQAKNKATSWAHQPYMASFTGSYSHTVGDCFIFRGGDTWRNSDTSINIQAGGNSSVQDYYGVDTTWPSLWSRPKIDVQSAVTPQNLFNFDAGYVTVDNFEIVDMSCDSSHSQTAWSPNANHGIKVTNSYVHSFQPPSGGCGGHEIMVYASGGSPACDGLFDHNIVNGSDGNTGYYTESNHGNDCSPVTHNVFHDLCSAVNSYTHLVAYNLIYNIGGWGGAPHNCSSTGGFHPDGIQTDTDSDIHDNVLYNIVGETIQLSPQGLSAWPVSHVYNNVVYQTAGDSSIPPVDIEVGTGGDPPSTNGVVYIYNNTLACDQVGHPGCIMFFINIVAATIENNHQINSSGRAEICIGNLAGSGCSSKAASFNYSPSSELYQTFAVASAAGYTANQTYAYSPSSSSSPTMGVASINLASSCSGSLPLCADTSYGSSVGSGNVATTGRQSNVRSSGSWGVGAYNIGSSASNPPPSPPSGLAAIVQ